ncbi:MAG: SRPBCC family protein [Pseudomonadota bacterium]
MPTVHAKQVFLVSVDELWAILSDFGDTGKWSGRPKDACVQEGKGLGSLRTLTLADGNEIVDRLEAESEYSYSYSVVSGNLPWERYKATMAVQPLADGSSLFTWTGEFEPKGMTEEKCVAFTESVYAAGIAMMKERIPAPD